MGFLNEIDMHFAKFIGRLSGTDEPDIKLAAALASYVTGQGDVCLDLDSTDKNVFSDEQLEAVSIAFPKAGGWQTTLRKSPVVGEPGEQRPLILDEKNRLYLYRYWVYEKTLAESIRRRATGFNTDINLEHLKISLKKIFPNAPAGETDWQKIASIIPVFKRFSVVSGGPGTGKTFTVAKILALLFEMRQIDKIRTYLSAPT
ncbi:AAA family ATPase, partial [Thermodesulfobacteriota bacterium]